MVNGREALSLTAIAAGYTTPPDFQYSIVWHTRTTFAKARQRLCLAEKLHGVGRERLAGVTQAGNGDLHVQWTGKVSRIHNRHAEAAGISCVDKSASKGQKRAVDHDETRKRIASGTRHRDDGHTLVEDEVGRDLILLDKAGFVDGTASLDLVFSPSVNVALDSYTYGGRIGCQLPYGPVHPILQLSRKGCRVSQLQPLLRGSPIASYYAAPDMVKSP